MIILPNKELELLFKKKLKGISCKVYAYFILLNQITFLLLIKNYIHFRLSQL